MSISVKYLYKFNQCFKDNLKYSYDASGNICQINENGKLLAKYTYDGLNRLIREDNAKLGKTYLFDYDQTGNITSRLECPFTLDNADSITAFDKAETLIYDGDRLIRTGSSDKSYYNANGKLTTYLGFSISFKEGGLISSYRSFNYEYDALGRRTKKGSITYTYSKNGLLTSQSDGISFIYDHSNQMIGIKKDYSTYYFRKNLQGDVIALLDSNGVVVVKYYYDAWGNHKIYNASGTEITDTTHIGHLNPIRYRGYYYDKEFGLYYLKSRYYDPTVGRFISQDDVDYADYAVIGGLNLYAYCNNNPVNYTDPTGKFAISAFIVGCFIGMAVGFGAATYVDYKKDGKVFNGDVAWYDYLGALFVGGAIGGFIGYATPYIGSFLGSSFSIGGGLTLSSGGAIAVSSGVTISGAQILTAIGASVGVGVLFAQTKKSGGYYGERWPGDHKPDHVHLRGNGTDIRIGRDGNPLPGEDKLGAQARKALERLWDEFLKLFNRW